MAHYYLRIRSTVAQQPNSRPLQSRPASLLMGSVSCASAQCNTRYRISIVSSHISIAFKRLFDQFGRIHGGVSYTHDSVVRLNVRATLQPHRQQSLELPFLFSAGVHCVHEVRLKQSLRLFRSYWSFILGQCNN